ncbi:CASP-like protein 5A1 isoform X2 [Pistacia vera]|uniref:CASP-like protein 5A1 isoform X2 n=1 Tax=Pistacia vera TaxID=55513 RepID=UPI0012632834|nr:CASP-like protein 5A1 isoform X2 [Pistacia vera]XP_031286672.1 CASP-like protein 5A1 isoform X2 [Pistacia vera]
MNLSRPAVHPVEAPPLTEAAIQNGPRLRMKDVQGMPGTRGGLILRLCQFVFSFISLCVMASTSDFHEATAFCYLVLAVGFQSLWSLSLAVLDIYAILVKRSLRSNIIMRLFTIGDGEFLLYTLYKRSHPLLHLQLLVHRQASQSSSAMILIDVL